MTGPHRVAFKNLTYWSRDKHNPSALHYFTNISPYSYVKESVHSFGQRAKLHDIPTISENLTDSSRGHLGKNDPLSLSTGAEKFTYGSAIAAMYLVDPGNLALESKRYKSVMIVIEY